MFFRREAEPHSESSVFRNQSGAARANRNLIGSVAVQQFGLVKIAQLRRRGMAKATIFRAMESGRLHHVHSTVYSLVPTKLMSQEAWLAAAILAGGPGARLCAASAGWWTGVWPHKPYEIHVAVGSDIKPVEGIQWHQLALAEAPIKHGRMPITTLERIPLDMAHDLSLWELKGVLAELEFHHGIEPDAIRPFLRRGYPGSAKLRQALAEHTPELALTRSHLERTFARFLIERGFVLPEFNHPAGVSTVDAIYEEPPVAIELDGIRGHTGERRILRDHRRDVHRRAEGKTPLRYHYTQIVNPRDQDLIERELDRLGVPRNQTAKVPESGT